MVFATIKETVSHANGNKFHTEIYCSQICRKHIVVNSVQEFRRDLQAVSQKNLKTQSYFGGDDGDGRGGGRPDGGPPTIPSNSR